MMKRVFCQILFLPGEPEAGTHNSSQIVGRRASLPGKLYPGYFAPIYIDLTRSGNRMLGQSRLFLSWNSGKLPIHYDTSMKVI
jgi:hypothetical protein